MYSYPLDITFYFATTKCEETYLSQFDKAAQFNMPARLPQCQLMQISIIVLNYRVHQYCTRLRTSTPASAV
jgi:hypothetical protein